MAQKYGGLPPPPGATLATCGHLWVRTVSAHMGPMSTVLSPSQTIIQVANNHGPWSPPTKPQHEAAGHCGGTTIV